MKLSNILIGIVLVGLIAVGGFFAYLYIAGGSGEASQDIGDVSEAIDNQGEGNLFRIISEQSEARFTLEEDLAGVRTTVVGTTDQVGGDIVLNFSNPSASEVGTITINARTLETDQGMRNQAIRANILRSAQDDYEFITFVPTSVSGLPESIEVGETYSFDITGDLTIIETTKEVTFNTEVTIVSETEISGTASTNILYGDWGIPVPSAPRVANVTEDVDLAIDFVAQAVAAD